VKNSFSLLETIFAITIISFAFSTIPNLYKTVSKMDENIYLKTYFSKNLTEISYFVEDSNYKNLTENSKVEINNDEVGESSLKIFKFTFKENGETLFQFQKFQSEENWSSFQKKIVSP
jgi:archaellum component FlaF (FlaF/FlaG flagellin family)